MDLSGRLIARLIADGKRVGVASTSHRAIHKLLDEVEEGAESSVSRSRERRRRAAGNPESDSTTATSSPTCSRTTTATTPHLVGGTAWLFADDEHDGMLDYLFIDEAGQVSLADALAMGTCARNLVLVGDPQQLGQVLQGSHPRRERGVGARAPARR